METRSVSDLWDALERDCSSRTGCAFLTIPHNSNLSDGLMFESARMTDPKERGLAIDATEAERRARLEPQVEIMQHKGDSECLPGGPSGDELCGFEKLPFGSLVTGPGRTPPRRSGMVRSALLRGLELEARTGTNPFRFGLVASTDTHRAAAGAVDERIPVGHGGASPRPGSPTEDPAFSPGGLAVVYAEENTRDSIFAALLRRESYATSGSRPLVRFFGGWELPSDLCSSPSLVAQGYRRGVAMGGELRPQPSGEPAPTFVVSALRDPGSADAAAGLLQRIQVIKGWVDGEGETHRAIVDVVGGSNGASVDTRTCEARGPGARSLCAVWSDPDFDPSERAFYYARVLENPRCRWSQYQCLDEGVDCAEPKPGDRMHEICCSELHRPVIQERAWTSPIWYSPPPAPPRSVGSGAPD